MRTTKLTDQEFRKTVERFIRKNRTFTEKHIGSTKTISLNKKTICKSSSVILQSKEGFDPKAFRIFLSLFNKNLFKNLRQVIDFNNLNVRHLSNRTVTFNHDYWETHLIGEFVYEFDIKSAYWQTAKILGYIDEKMFQKYYNDPSAKMYKRLCFSFLARHKKIVHYNKGVPHEIVCDNTILKQVYDNVRITLNNNIYLSVCQLDNFFKFNVDAIYVDLKNAHKVNKALKELGYDFHFRVWVKSSETEISNKNQIKKLF
jgi:hypothetical protein